MGRSSVDTGFENWRGGAQDNSRYTTGIIADRSHGFVPCLGEYRPFICVNAKLHIRVDKNLSCALQQWQITPMEADTIILSENDVINGRLVVGEDGVQYPAKADGRTVRVAHLYVHARVLVNRCLQICGIDLFEASHFEIIRGCLLLQYVIAGICVTFTGTREIRRRSLPQYVGQVHRRWRGLSSSEDRNETFARRGILRQPSHYASLVPANIAANNKIYYLSLSYSQFI